MDQTHCAASSAHAIPDRPRGLGPRRVDFDHLNLVRAEDAQPHGFTIDEPDRLAFISCEGNAALIVLDLRTMQPVQHLAVADDPDVLAWDPAWRRLYVSAESGVLAAFWLDGTMLKPAGEIRAPHAHTVSVDPRTHRVYLPLENIKGHPVLRIYAPRAEAGDRRIRSGRRGR